MITNILLGLILLVLCVILWVAIAYGNNLFEKGDK
jgi:hypothetical protein